MKSYPEDTVNDGTDSFSEAAYYDLLALAYQVEDTSETMTPREMIKTKEAFEHMVSMLTGKAGIRNTQQWEDDVRVINALRTAIEKGILQVDTVDDLETLRMIILSGLRESPQVIEYYLKTGELMALTRLLLTYKSGHPLVSGAMVLAVKARQFYSLEMRFIEDALGAGGDPAEFYRMPLTLRVDFFPEVMKLGMNMRTATTSLRVLPEFDHEEIFARFGYTMEWLDNGNKETD